jgi:transposase
MPIRNSRQHIKKVHDLAHDDRFDVWAVDEVRFEQHGSACRMWIPPEVTDPVLLHHPTRKGIGYFGAVRIRDGKFIYCREKESFNGETFFSFLKQVGRVSCHAGRHVVLILDNVKYHHAKLHLHWREKSREHLTLAFMPPYSPELNPIERVWKLTRRMATHNRYFPTLTAVISSVENVFSHWHAGNDTLRRLCVI